MHGNNKLSGFSIDLLRNSGDPETETYYKSVKARGQAAQAAEKRAKALKIAQVGGEVKLGWKKGTGDTDRWMIRIGSIEADMTVPATTVALYRLVKNQLLCVRYDIIIRQHPHKFVENCSSSDDCWGLGVLITGPQINHMVQR